jgi:hypothetical protein
MDYVVASTTATYMWLPCKAGSLNITSEFVFVVEFEGIIQLYRKFNHKKLIFLVFLWVSIKTNKRNRLFF